MTTALTNIERAMPQTARKPTMPRWVKGPLLALMMAVGLSACMAHGPHGSHGHAGHAPGPNKQLVGTIVGAGLGGLLGSQMGQGDGKLAAVAIGTLAGAAIGNGVGSSLDQADQAFLQQAEYRAVNRPNRRPVSWHNPDTGHFGETRAGRPYREYDGQVCRDYQTTANIDGRIETVEGQACRTAGGTWRIRS